MILRFCPEDLKAVVFSPKLKTRIDFLQRTVNAAIDGLETLQVRYEHTLMGYKLYLRSFF